MLWVDKYRPKTLDQVLVHQDIAQNLKKLVTPFSLSSSNFPFWCSDFRSRVPILDFSFFNWAGHRGGLPPFALLWPLRLRQENPNNGTPSPDLRFQCREGFFLCHFFYRLLWVYLYVWFPRKCWKPIKKMYFFWWSQSILFFVFCLPLMIWKGKEI